MTQHVPIKPGDVDQEFSVQLDGVEYVLRAQWQDRDESWYLDVLTAALVPVFMGARIAVGVPLLFQLVAEVRPAGDLIPIDTTGGDNDPGLDDFGIDESLPEAERYKRVQLFYLDAADVAEAIAP